MKITTMLKWLPVFLSALGALGYGSRDTELIRSSVQIVSDITDSRHFGLESVGALLTDTIRPKSSENEQSKTGIHKKAPYTYHGKIAKIHDGDTLHVIDEDGKNCSLLLKPNYSLNMKQKEKY